MVWNAAIAQNRISDLMKSNPEVIVENYVEQYLPKHQRMMAEARALGTVVDDKPLFNLKKNEAVLVDGVHIYANLINYDDYLLAEGIETAASHERALNFLHLHYSACDRVVENCDAQRVDFHGGRMHAVILEPTGAHNEGQRVAKAIILAEQLRSLSSSAALEMRNGDYVSKYRFGIDTGKCVATNSGQGLEPEPLFLGSAANHAAKLADGEEVGIFISDTAQAALVNKSIPSVGNLFDRLVDERLSYKLDETSLPEIALLNVGSLRRVDEIFSNWQADIRLNKDAFVAEATSFQFHKHKLPLNTIEYEKLMPSNSVRMTMVSVFGDLDGYTKYVDGAMSDFGRLGNAVRNLHVIRGEMANVVHDDFEGRKVRFIGDCIHGILSAGEDTEVNEKEAVRQAIHCAGGLRSSFELCKDQLPEANQLGLAIGIELGDTPVTRLGIRGERSVRVASSVSTSSSEDEQKRCDGVQTAIGSIAYSACSQSARALFNDQRKVANLDFDTADIAVPTELASPTVQTSGDAEEFRAHSL